MNDAVKKQLAVFKDGLVELIAEPELAARLERSIKTGKPLRIKYGVDPSASDIHLGHTVPHFKLRALQELGHRVLFLIGDFTARIGDPSHKSEMRKTLTKEEVKANAASYAEQVFKILDPKKTDVVYNSEWLEKLTSEEFLRLMLHTTVHRMIERDDFKKRFEEKRPISLLEFMYPLLQGYDSVHLRSDIEIGGTDQKFNLLMGRELQRDHGQEPQVVMTLPILEGTDGAQKMSKSIGNAISINLPPAEMFGSVMRLKDEQIIPFFRYTTRSSPEDVAALENRMKEGDNPRDLKARLGRAIVSFYHNEKEALSANEQFDKQFRDKEIPDNIPEVDLSAQSGSVIDEVIKRDYKANISEILALSAVGLSNSEMRRLLAAGAIKIDQKKITDLKENFDLKSGPVVQFGKRHLRRFKKIK